jgi:hypothetical protein
MPGSVLLTRRSMTPCRAMPAENALPRLTPRPGSNATNKKNKIYLCSQNNNKYDDKYINAIE